MATCIQSARRGLVLCLMLALGAIPWCDARAERPSSTRLFPRSTVAYLSVPSAQDLQARLRETAMGQMSRDPQLSPLLGQLFGTLSKAFGAVEAQVGVSLDELLSMPQGEFAIGVLATEGNPLSVVAMLDANDHLPALQKLLDRGAEALTQAGATQTDEVEGDVKIVIFSDVGPGRAQVAYFEKEGTLVLGNRLEVIKEILARWNGTTAGSLAENSSYAAIRERSRGPQDEQPQLVWYVDPIELVKNIAAGNANARIGLAILPVLGLDGLLGMGGTVTLATEQFDTITHLHVLLNNPRAGVVDLLALGNGDIAPPSWVPADASSYTTLHWDVEKTYQKLSALIDSFQGQGTFARQVQQRVNERIGLDLEKEILASLHGRFTLANVIEKPATALNSQATLAAARLKDPEAFQPILDKLIKQFAAGITKQSYGGETYYEVGTPNADPAAPAARRPCFGILGDDLLFADRSSAYQQAIVTMGDSSQSLAEGLEYKLIASRIGRQRGGEKPGMISFSRPEESMRMLYDLINSDQARTGLGRAAENNDIFKDLNRALEENPLPPFAVLQKYLAPGGGLLTDDDTGFHYMSFTLRREPD